MKRKFVEIGVFTIIFICIFVYAGKYDTQINKENAISDSIVESNKQESLLGDSIAVNDIYNSLTDSQISEIIYNTNRETWDTIYKANIIETYLLNAEYYDSIPDDGNIRWLNNITIL